MLGLLLTRQRTGSGALGTILHRHPALFYLGEILHPDDAKAPAAHPRNFFVYLAAEPERARLYANAATREPVIKSYFAWLEAETAPRAPVLDVKYRSLQHWNLGWQGPLEPPWLIRQAKQRKMPILHLCRRNYAATFVSGRLADANQVWHTGDKAAIKVKSLAVPAAELLSFIRNSAREVALIRDWLGRYDKVLTLEYEEMLDADGNMPAAVAAELAGFLNIAPFAQLNSVFVKQAPARLQDCIENFDEVAKALRDTEFSWMLK